MNRYRLWWSDEDDEYVAVCLQWPGLTCLEPDPEAALSGIKKLVAEVEEMKRAGELDQPGILA